MSFSGPEELALSNEALRMVENREYARVAEMLSAALEKWPNYIIGLLLLRYMYRISFHHPVPLFQCSLLSARYGLRPSLIGQRDTDIYEELKERVSAIAKAHKTLQEHPEQIVEHLDDCDTSRYILGYFLYLSDKGELAKQYFLPLAEKGHAGAQCSTGYLFYKGDTDSGTDYEMAVKW